MGNEPLHICFTCEHVKIAYSDMLDKEMTYCQIIYEQASHYREKVFSGGKLVHCPAFKERKVEAENGGD